MGMYFMCYVHNKHEEDEQESGLSTCWRDPGHDTAINNSASDAVLPTIAPVSYTHLTLPTIYSV